MGRQVTFLHAADLHLGAPLRGLRALSQVWAERIAEAIPAAFDRLIETALNRKVDFVVLSGDIFDQAQPSFANYLRFASGLTRLHEAHIPTYMCSGNHDPYTSWRGDMADFPGSAYMFSANKPSFCVFEREGQPLVLLGGRGFYNQVFSVQDNIAEGITRAAAERECATTAPFALGVLHTGLNIDPNKAPTKPADLLRAEMDYWALGHIHLPWLDDETNPRIGFPGCIQGRDIKETGPHGCYLVTLEEGRPNTVEFVALASVVWQIVGVDISACTTLSEVKDHTMEALFELNGQAQCDEMVTRISLKGRTPLHSLLREPGMLEDLRSQINASHRMFFCDRLLDETTSPLEVDALRNEGLFPATLLKVQAELQGHEGATRQYLEQEFLARGISLPASTFHEGNKLQENAAGIALDILQCGGQN